MGKVYLVKKTKRKYLDGITQNEQDLVQIFLRAIFVLRRHGKKFLATKSNKIHDGRVVSLKIFVGLCKKFTNMTRTQIGSFIDRDADQVAKDFEAHEQGMKDSLYKGEFRRHELLCLFLTGDERFLSGDHNLTISSSELCMVLASFGIKKAERAQIMSAVMELASHERPSIETEEIVSEKTA